MKTIKLWFTDFYVGFKPQDNYLFQLISKHYSVELDKYNPDYLIYSCYGRKFLDFNCIRIFYTGENIIPDFNLCDYAIGFGYLHLENRYLRFPNFAFYNGQFEKLIKPEDKTPEKLSSKKYFCNFIYSNSQADPVRDHFYHLLTQYKNVASPGIHLNNISLEIGNRFDHDWMFSKIDFQSKCKFSIAFENTSSRGYTTEKLLHAFISNTIPIYWGDPDVAKDFNPEAFINLHNFENLHDVVERVKEIDNDDELYMSILQKPPFRSNKIPENLREETLLAFLKNIFDQEKENAKQRSSYGTVIKYENEIKDLISKKKPSKGDNKIWRYFKKLS